MLYRTGRGGSLVRGAFETGALAILYRGGPIPDVGRRRPATGPTLAKAGRRVGSGAAGPACALAPRIRPGAGDVGEGSRPARRAIPARGLTGAAVRGQPTGRQRGRFHEDARHPDRRGAGPGGGGP